MKGGYVMARTRRKISIDEKIGTAQEKVFRLKEQYDAAVSELNQLLKKKEELKKAELIEALEASKKSYDEILTFLQEGTEK